MATDQGKTLNELEEEIYSWQVDVTGFGLEGQQKLKQATVMISRCGGLGGVVAYELAAAGIGRLVLAHAGNIKPSDLNRQLLMTRQAMGTSRMDSIVTRLRDLNPDLEILPIRENVSEANVNEMVSQVDVVVDTVKQLEQQNQSQKDAIAELRSSAGGADQLKQRLDDIDAAIKAFDQYRIQVNNRLDRLEQ